MTQACEYGMVKIRNFVAEKGMPIEVLLPALSPTMTHGHLVKWHKQIGEWVRPGDLLMDIETDKAVMEVEATQEGVMDRIVVQAPADSVAIGCVIALLRHEHEPEGISHAWVAQADLTVDTETNNASNASSSSAHTTVEQAGTLSHTDAEKRILVSPLARKLAALQQIDLTTVTGTGPGGRIVKKDIERQAQGVAPQIPVPAAHAVPAQQESHQDSHPLHPVDHQAKPSSEAIRRPVSGMRRMIAERLTLSKQTIPHFSLSLDCRVDALLALRSQMNTGDTRISVNDFVLRACALALWDVPAMRTLWGEGADQGFLVEHPHVDLAVAVSIPGGLVTPILTKAETKSLRTLSQEVKSLAARAREGKLRPQEYQGGTFTVSNLGMHGITSFQPIINPPHSGILAVGAVRQTCIVQEGRIEVGSLMNVTLAADHRAVDGEDGARFLACLKSYLENPYGLLS